jgi:dienelactone hydrolase
MSLALLIALYFSLVSQLDFQQPTGIYAVGRTTMQWVDQARLEPLTATPDDRRSIVIEIWYPAEPGTGTLAPYFPNLALIADGLVASGEVAVWHVFGLRFVRSYSLLNARVDSSTNNYPVILLSPGNATNGEFYTGIADDLASHGYIVVGINHPYDVAAVALAGGHVAQFVEGPSALEERQEWVSKRIAERTADALFVLEQLAFLDNQTDGILAGRLDLERIAIMGHSLGGITAAEACRRDRRLKACLNMDGIQLGGPFSTNDADPPPQQPFMMITKEAHLHPTFIAKFAAIPAGSYRVVLYGAQHDSFTDGPLLQPSLLPIANQADRILAHTRTYTRAFFDQVMRDQPSDLLAKPSQSGEVAVEVYAPHTN